MIKVLLCHFLDKENLRKPEVTSGIRVEISIKDCPNMSPNL